MQPKPATTTTLFQALIKTHHMTSRRKIQAIAKSAKHNACSVVLKTGKPPGVMIAQGEEAGVREWVDGVKRLRYKDYRLLRLEAVKQGSGQLSTPSGNVEELDSMKDLSAYLAECEMLPWWTEHMGFAKGGA
ncbi:MAG: hypothetical protein L6R40_005406 [Gallowayella cf. fulva]|nr:MAG: hypothetical protein L6R40_005406 [Xanthomendoza cf. fulva]